MSLSEKSLKVVGTEVPEVKEQIVYYEKDVKEFIKKLKEELGAKSYDDAQGNINEGIIDKLAGEELI